MAKIFDVYVAADLYEAGITEDGERFIAERYFVEVEFEDGMRHRHHECFDGCKIEDYVEDFGSGRAFLDVRPEAKAKAERLVSRVKAALEAGRNLDLTHWYEGRAAYGSRAYCEIMAVLETQEERDNY